MAQVTIPSWNTKGHVPNTPVDTNIVCPPPGTQWVAHAFCVHACQNDTTPKHQQEIQTTLLNSTTLLSCMSSGLETSKQQTYTTCFATARLLSICEHWLGAPRGQCVTWCAGLRYAGALLGNAQPKPRGTKMKIRAPKEIAMSHQQPLTPKPKRHPKAQQPKANKPTYGNCKPPFAGTPPTHTPNIENHTG